MASLGTPKRFSGITIPFLLQEDDCRDIMDALMGSGLTLCITLEAPVRSHMSFARSLLLIPRPSATCRFMVPKFQRFHRHRRSSETVVEVYHIERSR